MFNKRFLVALFLLIALAAPTLAADLVNLAPERTSLVMNLNLGKLLATEMLRTQIDAAMAKQAENRKKGLQDFTARTGIDPFKHLQKLMIFMAFSVDQAGTKPQTGLLLEGSFEPARILESLTKDQAAAAEATVTKIEGFDAVQVNNNAEGNALILDGSTVAIGALPVITSIASVKSGKGKGLAGTDLEKLLKKVDTNAVFWGIGLVPQIPSLQGAEDTSYLPMYCSLDLGTGLSFTFTIELAKAEHADMVVTFISGALNAMRLKASQSPEFTEILNNVQVEATEKTVQAGIHLPKIPPTFFEKLRQILEAQFPAPQD